MRGEFDEISVHLKTYHCIHFVGLQACKWSRSKTLWFLDSGAVENNKHQTLSFPISVGFKKTPYNTKSYSKPPGQTVFVCVSLTISALNIGFGRFSTWGEGAQATASEANRPSACARHSRGSRGLAPWRGLQKDSTPLPKKIWYFAS